MNKIKIPEYGKHILFIGSTGSGKSELAIKMLQYVDCFFIFDTQNSIDIKNAYVAKKPSEAIKAIKNKTKKIIYKPKMEFQDMQINGYIISVLGESSRKHKKFERVVYIDEVFHLGYKTSFPRELPIAFATFRQKGLSLWVATQRPMLIPTNLMSEATELYMFYLSKTDDIKYIADNIRSDKKEFIEIALGMQKENYKFIYIDLTRGIYNLYNKIKLN